MLQAVNQTGESINRQAPILNCLAGALMILRYWNKHVAMIGRIKTSISSHFDLDFRRCESFTHWNGILKLILMLLFAGYSLPAVSQMPCTPGANPIIYFASQGIWNYDPTIPVSATNPVPNTILLPPGGPGSGVPSGGIAISPVLGSGNPTPTFYTITYISNAGNLTFFYSYYDGSGWVNTGHIAGSPNIGAGGGFIYGVLGKTVNNVFSTDIYRYDGTGNAVVILTLPFWVGIADVVATCDGNFYLLETGPGAPQALELYDPNGVLLNSWAVTGMPVQYGGGGFSIIGNTVYVHNLQNFYSGTLGPGNINFSIIPSVGFSPNDFAECSGAPAVTSHHDTVYYCEGGPSMALNAQGAGPFNWTVVSGTAAITGNGTSISVLPQTDAVIEVSSTGTGCLGTATIKDTFSIIIAKAKLDAGADDTLYGCSNFLDTLHAVVSDTTAGLVYQYSWSPSAAVVSGGSWCCGSDTVDFINASADSAASFHWIFGDNSFSTDTNPRHIYAGPGSYTTALIVSNGICADTLTAVIDLLHLLDASFVLSADTICQGAQVFLTNTSTASASNSNFPVWAWLYQDSIFSMLQHPVWSAQDTGNISITLLVTDSVGCTDTAIHTLQADPFPEAGFDLSDSTLCEGQGILFTGHFTQTGLVQSEWQLGDGHETVGTNVLHAYDTAGAFTVSFSADYRRCPSVSFTRIIDVHPFPSLNLGPDTFLCPNGQPLYIRNHGAGFGSNAVWRWNTGDSSDGLLVRHPGIYNATVTLDGCSTSDSMEVYKDCYLDIPNAFTPNGDGVNDYFLPRQVLSKSLSGFSMQVFNRWGQIIFETSRIDGRGWDGRFNGTVQPDGVYIYLINAVFEDGASEQYKGNVTLLR
ncbi:MAG: T9SS type B sorting domain-containing protein [Sphingobacteriales bacterium]|nr:MAG: T9SS type B sorting domain-containing protein [Sphingobacteriales bacterium]